MAVHRMMHTHRTHALKQLHHSPRRRRIARAVALPPHRHREEACLGQRRGHLAHHPLHIRAVQRRFLHLGHRHNHWHSPAVPTHGPYRPQHLRARLDPAVVHQDHRVNRARPGASPSASASGILSGVEAGPPVGVALSWEVAARHERAEGVLKLLLRLELVDRTRRHQLHRLLLGTHSTHNRPHLRPKRRLPPLQPALPKRRRASASDPGPPWARPPT
mmetsp:Transcript_68558/g.142961  ORF Transcript_68558/g.142961 Transcript_68558/m.142961 type:complete len:218 (+) Transcript_68558:555-1208(+)